MSQRIAAVAILVCGLSAHGATFDAPYSPTAPTIDGSLSGGEWVGASSNRITMVHNNPAVTHLSTVYFKHDNTWLYIGVNTEFSNTSDMYWACEFDGNNSHARDGNASEPHVDISISAAGPSRPSYYNRYDAHPTTGAISVTPPTGTAKASAGSNPVTFEFKVKISELGATPGSLIGFYFQQGYDGSTSYGYTYVDVPIAQWSHIRLLNGSLSQGLVAYYPFDNSFSDSSGNGNNGTSHGVGFSSDRFGNPNSCAYFDGNSHYVEVPRSSSLEPQQLTVSAWVNPADMQHWQIVLGKRRSTTSDPLNSYILDTTWSTPPLSWRFCTSPGGVQDYVEGPVIQTNQWSFLAGTDDGARRRLYVNGQLVADEASGGTIPYSSLSLFIGSVPSFGQAFKGKIDDVRIYNRGLSQGEVWELYTGYVPASVSNVRASQRPGTRLVDIYYDVVSPNPVYAIASATTNGTAWTIPFSSLSGDVARNVTPGGNRHIVWDAGTDWGNHATGSMIVRITGGATPSDSAQFPVNTLSSGTWYIRVWADKNSNDAYDAGEEIDGAEVYFGNRDSEGNKIGMSGSDGKITVTTSAYQGAILYARKQIYSRPAVKAGHALADNLMFRLWLDSDGPRYGDTDSGIMYADPENSSWNGTWQSCRLTPSGMATAQAGGTVNLQLRHPVFEWNLMIALETADATFLNQLRDGLGSASSYLYDITDGQMKLGSAGIHIGVAQGSAIWRNADMVIYADNNYGPNARVGGISDPGDTHMSFGTMWRDGWSAGTTPNQDTYFNTIIHEFGHYALGFWDEYIDGWGNKTAWNQYRAAHPSEVPGNYGLMDYQYSASEMSSLNDYLSSYPLIIFPHMVTKEIWQHDIGNLLSDQWFPCWQWLEHEFETSYGGIPVQIIVPQAGTYPNNVTSDRDGPTFVPGPYWLFTSTSWLPAPDGKYVALAAATATAPATEKTNISTVQVVEDGIPAVGAIVLVEEAMNHRVVRLGKTDKNGCLSTRDIAPGASLRVTKHGLQASRTVLTQDVGNRIWIELHTPNATKIIRLAELSGHTATNLGLVISGALGASPNRECTYEVKSSKALLAPPTVMLHLDDSPAISVTMSNVSVNSYRGSFAVSNASAGTVELQCSSADGETANTLDAFSIQDVSSNNAAQISSRSGWSDVMIQGGGVSADSAVVFYQSYAPPILPAGFERAVVGPVMFIGLGQDVSLIGTNAVLNVHYGDSDATGVDETSVGLYRWNKAQSAWDVVQSTASPADNLVSAMLDSFGVFALFANPTNDAVAPGAVGDFVATTGTNGWSVALAWTDTGDDATNGIATSYDLRFSPCPIVETNWAAASPYRLGVTPQSNGTPRAATLAMPGPGLVYYFVMRVQDKAGNLGPLSACVSAQSLDADSDGDGLSDSWEATYQLNATNSADAADDSDGDGLNNLEEHAAGTSQRTWDTDGDGMGDKWEVDNHLNPTSGDDRNSDNDNDGLTNYEEYQHFTNPNQADTDEDGLPDKWELDNGLNPLTVSGDHGASADPDGDSLPNLSEYAADTLPTNSSSFLGISGIQMSGGNAVLSWHGGILATQWVERSQSLSSTGGTWVTVLTNLPPTSVLTNWTDEMENEMPMFYRIKARR